MLFASIREWRTPLFAHIRIRILPACLLIAACLAASPAPAGQLGALGLGDKATPLLGGRLEARLPVGARVEPLHGVPLGSLPVAPGEALPRPAVGVGPISQARYPMRTTPPLHFWRCTPWRKPTRLHRMRRVRDSNGCWDSRTATGASQRSAVAG